MKRLIFLVVVLVACQKEAPVAPPMKPGSPPMPMTSTETKTTTAAQPAQITSGLQTPESVLYDADQDVYFISNINGQPLDADNNGYVSRVKTDTRAGDR